MLRACLLVARLLILDAVRVLLHRRLPRDLEAAAPLLLLLLPVRALLVGGALRRDPPRLRVRLHVRPGVVGRPDERRGGRLVLHARRLGRLESRVLRVHLVRVRVRVRAMGNGMGNDGHWVMGNGHWNGHWALDWALGIGHWIGHWALD